MFLRVNGPRRINCMRLRSDRKLWPPILSGSYGRGDTFLTDDSKGIFKSAVVRGKMLELQIEFEGREVIGSIGSGDEQFLKRACETMNQHQSVPLKEIGDLDIPER